MMSYLCCILIIRERGACSQTNLLLIPVLAALFLLSPQILDRLALHSSDRLCNSERSQAAAFSFISLSFHLQEIFLNLSLDVLLVPTASPAFFLLWVSSFLLFFTFSPVTFAVIDRVVCVCLQSPILNWNLNPHTYTLL